MLLLALSGTGSSEGAAGAILIGAVVCCAAAIGGDNLQDLKTGYLVGATPWKQQVMQIIGTLSAAAVLGLVLDILHTAYTIGSADFPAPQATLMKSVAEGVFSGSLPWEMVQAGAIIGIIIIILDTIQEKRGANFRLPVLAVAVGIYLPISLSTPIFLGGMIAHFTNSTIKDTVNKADRVYELWTYINRPNLKRIYFEENYKVLSNCINFVYTGFVSFVGVRMLMS